MCLFPFRNNSIKSIAYKKGITEFKCGCCPECLADRARLWALRASAEARYNIGCMVTLTYDDYKYDNRGKRVGELPPRADLPLSKEHCQKFMKRLRKHFNGTEIKYIITAERGKRTNRAHYHAILFGVEFVDRIRYKTSKRGNIIYTSKTLTDIWGHGIATIDCVNITAQVARYCTKYCAKDSRADDTFMLFSRGIGDRWLLENFNGIGYTLDGRQYTIPRTIWNKVIDERYKRNYVYFRCGASPKYRSLRWYLEKFPPDLAYYMADLNVKYRRNFRAFRDKDKQYIAYLEYWSKKAKQYDELRPSSFQRILQLPNTKYFTYKQRALECLYKRSASLFPEEAENLILPPRYNSAYRYENAVERLFSICRIEPCHNTANDTESQARKTIRALVEAKPWVEPCEDNLESPFKAYYNAPRVVIRKKIEPCLIEYYTARDIL